MTSANNKKEILSYVLKDVLELSDESVEILIKDNGYDTVRKLATISDRMLENLLEIGALKATDVDQLPAFREWYVEQCTHPNLLPSTMDQWREMLTADKYDDYRFKKTPVQSVPDINLSNPTRMADVSIKLSDYPVFGGSMSQWSTFKKSFKATAMLTPLGPLLDETDYALHDIKIKSDNTYNMNVKELYGILMNRTAAGLASSKIMKYEKEKDGVLAWKELLEYYELGGNATKYATQKLKEMTTLEYRGNAQGGFDAYINKFESLCLELEKTDQHLSDELKKQFFLLGIKDPDFDQIKDVISGLGLQETLIEIRHKAQNLNGQQDNVPRRRHNRKQLKSDYKNKKTPNKTNFERDAPTKTEDTSDGRVIPEAVWKTLTPANKKRWVKDVLKKGSNRKSSYGRQYDPSANRQANVATTSPNKAEEQRILNDDKRFHIWRPEQSTRKQNNCAR